MMLVPMMSAGIRSGVNWIRENVSSSAFRQRPDQQRLAQPGHAFEQHVAAGEQADQHVVDDVAVADDHLPDLGPKALEGGDKVPNSSVLRHRGSSPWILTARTIPRDRSCRQHYRD